MTVGDYLVGAGWFVLMLVPVLITAWLLLERRLGELAGSARVIAFGLVATAMLMGVHLVPGALTVLSRETVAATALVSLALVWRFVPSKVRSGELREAPPSTRGQWVLAVAGLGVVAVYQLAYLLEQIGQPIYAIDVLTFEMPFVVHWIQEGSMWPVHTYWYGWSPGNYPMNGDLVSLATTMPWRADALLRVSYLPWHVLTGAGVYAIARELGSARPSAVGAAALVLALPTVALTALEFGKPDPVMFATFTGGLTFLLRFARTGVTSDLVLAGLGLGLALGTKWYGLTCVVVVVAAFVLSRTDRRRLAHGAALAGVATLAGGFWFVRNWVSSGNPLYPQRVEVAGVTLFDAPRDYRREQLGDSIADHLTDRTAWEAGLLEDLRNGFALPGALCLLALLAALVVCRRDRRVLALALTGLALLVAYVITPYTAQIVDGEPRAFPGVRYAVPGLALGAVCVAVMSSRVWPVLAVAVLLAALDGVMRVDDLGGIALDVTRPVLALSIAAAAVATLALARLRPPLRPTLAATAVVALGVGYVHFDRFMPARYRGIDKVTDHVLDELPENRRIGIAGRTFYTDLAPVAVLPLAGPRFRNFVQVMGPVRRSRLYGPPSRNQFLAQIDRDSLDTLVLLRPPADSVAPEEAWASTAGFEVRARGPISALMVKAR